MADDEAERELDVSEMVALWFVLDVPATVDSLLPATTAEDWNGAELVEVIDAEEAELARPRPARMYSASPRVELLDDEDVAEVESEGC
ncbi:hypothetical protein LTR85_011452 [Meristemomyces frigidus]|nr:hypothetical protein LTR85_011452 [Meristemomyces frigidus]